MEKLTSKENSLIKNYAKLASSKKERDGSGLFVLEGVKLLGEAVQSGLSVQTVLITGDCLARHGDQLLSGLSAETEIYQIADSLEGRMTKQVTPQGVYAILPKLDKTLTGDTIEEEGKYLFLCSLQDTGNLGTLFRTAEAMGIQGIFLTRDTCDVYNPKTLRGSMGSVFRVPFGVVEDPVAFLSEMKKKGVSSYASVVSGEVPSVTETLFQTPSLLLIGNEGNGLDPELIEAASHRVTIRMSGKAESLNAAAAACILMWEMTR